MKNDFEPMLQITADTFSRVEGWRVLRFYTTQTASHLIVAFSMFAVPFTLGVALPFEWWGGPSASFASAATAGVLFGLLGVICVFHKEPRYFSSLLSDCRAGACDSLTVCATRAIAFETTVSTPSIALTCGSGTVILFGGWWLLRTSRKDITWSGSAQPNAFPSNQFVLRRLPRTGRVLSVAVAGRPLTVERHTNHLTQNLPNLTIQFPLSMDCHVVSEPLDSLIKK